MNSAAVQPSQQYAVGRQCPGSIQQLFPYPLGGSPGQKGEQIDQEEPAFPKPIMTVLDPLVALCILHNGTQDDLFHNLPWHQGQADKPVAP